MKIAPEGNRKLFFCLVALLMVGLLGWNGNMDGAQLQVTILGIGGMFIGGNFGEHAMKRSNG